MSWLDRLPAPARHALILMGLAPLTILVSVPATQVIANGGITGLDWHTVWTSAIDGSAASLASGALAWVALVVTPLTRQYGVGQSAEIADEDVA